VVGVDFAQELGEVNNNKANIQAFCIVTRLLFTRKWVFFLTLSFQYAQWETSIVEQQVVNIALRNKLKIVPDLRNIYTRFQLNISPSVFIIQKTPTGTLKPFIYLYPSRRFSFSLFKE